MNNLPKLSSIKEFLFERVTKGLNPPTRTRLGPVASAASTELASARPSLVLRLQPFCFTLLVPTLTLISFLMAKAEVGVTSAKGSCSINKKEFIDAVKLERENRFCQVNSPACDNLGIATTTNIIGSWIRRLLYPKFPENQSEDQKLSFVQTWIKSGLPRSENSSKNTYPPMPSFPLSESKLLDWYSEVLRLRPEEAPEKIQFSDPLFPDGNFPLKDWKDKLTSAYFKNPNLKIYRVSPQQLSDTDLDPILNSQNRLCSIISALKLERAATPRAGPKSGTDAEPRKL